MTEQTVFIIDLARCVGCYTCRIACKDRADLPDDLDLLRVEQHEEGTYPNPRLYYRVVHCFHCARPPCADICPADAYSKDENGLVALDGEKCVGCGTCQGVCPFGAIVMLPEDIAVKCDGCAGEVEPVCVRACPMRALRYEVREVGDEGIGAGVVYLHENS